MRHLSLLVCYLFVTIGNPVTGQDGSRVLISMRNEMALVGVDNPFWVEIEQSESVTLDQLSAVLWRNNPKEGSEPIPLSIQQNGDYFFLNPPGIGQLEISVRLKNGSEEIYTFEVRPITAVVLFGGNRHRGSPTNTNVFRCQRGLYAEIISLDVDARCIVVSYEVVRISKGQESKAMMNIGGDFQLETRELIDLAKPGDHYIFTKIRYRCPGAQADQMGETLNFEIR